MKTHDLWNGKVGIGEVTAFWYDIQPHLSAFIVNVGSAGLWSRINESDKRGMEGTFGSVVLRSYVIIGRIMLTFDDGNHQITLIAPESVGPTRIGMQSVDAELGDVRNMLNEVIRLWPSTVDEQRVVFHNSDKVSIA